MTVNSLNRPAAWSRRGSGAGRDSGLPIAALLLALGLAACGRAEEPRERQPVAVKVATVEPTAGRAGRRYSASVRPDVDVEMAFKVGGYVDEILLLTGADGRRRPLQEGDVVRRGTVLAHVRDNEYRDRLAEAQASMTQAKSEYERTARMYENHAASKAEYDAAYARAASSRARYDQAVLTLEDCSLKASMDGTVLSRRIEVGTLVSPGAPAFRLADTRSVKVVVGVPDVEVVHLEMGAVMEITAEAFPGVKFPGRITRISASADASSRVFEVECTIPNGEGRLRTGMIATLLAASPGTSAGGTPVPLNAVVRPADDPEGYAVFVVEEKDGRQFAVSRKVELGDVIGNAIEVNQGLAGGERVIVTGATLVLDQQEVRIIP
jgi:RND family efflux transporter MFP subunit